MIATSYIYNPQNVLQGMTNNIGLTCSVGDTTPQFTIGVEQENCTKIGDTKLHI